jgi:hypothetical protein
MHDDQRHRVEALHRLAQQQVRDQAIVQERLKSHEWRDTWQTTAEGARHLWSREVSDLAQGREGRGAGSCCGPRRARSVSGGP